jgi:hypothetical protein
MDAGQGRRSRPPPPTHDRGGREMHRGSPGGRPPRPRAADPGAARSRGGGSADLLDPVVPSSPPGWSSGAAPHPRAAAPNHHWDPPHRRDVDGARSAVVVREEQGSAVQGRTSRSPRPLRFFLQDAQPASTRRRTLPPRLRIRRKSGAGEDGWGGWAGRSGEERQAEEPALRSKKEGMWAPQFGGWDEGEI